MCLRFVRRFYEKLNNIVDKGCGVVWLLIGFGFG